VKIKTLLSKSYVRHVILFLSVFMLAQLFITAGMFYLFQRSADRKRDELSGNFIEALDKTVTRSVQQAEADLQSLMAANIDIRILSGQQENARITVANNLANTLSSLIASAQATDIYFIYNAKNDIFLLSRSGRVLYSELGTLRRFAEGLEAGGGSQVMGWSLVSLEGKHYLMRSYHYYGCHFIAAFHLETFFTITSYDTLLDSGACAVLTDGNASVLAASGSCPLPEEITNLNELPGEYYINTRALSLGGLSGSYICRRSSEARVDILTMCLAAACLSTLILLAVFLRYLRHEILTPIDELSKATNIIRQGDYTHRARLSCRSPELQELAESVNSMTGTIINQRIASYESAIKQKNLELKYLQMQLRPHHFLNTLSTISSMTYLGDNERIQRFVELYSQDARYLFSGSLRMVPLADEVQHIQDYINCQAILYPDCVFSFIEVQPEAERWLIPQMILHALVENIYKHAVSLDTFTSFFIHASLQTADGEEMLELVIEDDGQGFPEDVIERVNHGGGDSSDPAHVGLMNISHTLCLIYEREHLMELSNKKERGSAVRLTIPRNRSGGAEWKGGGHADPDC